MEAEVVSRPGWLTRQQFVDLIGATYLIPGPNSMELAIHIGYTRGGWRGLIAAGACFIFPAMLMVWALAVVYVHYQTLPRINGLLYGVKPVILAVIVQALWRLGTTAAKDVRTGVVGVGATIMALLGWHPLLLLAMAGVGLMLVNNSQHAARRHLFSIVPSVAVFLPASLASQSAAATRTTLWRECRLTGTDDRCHLETHHHGPDRLDHGCDGDLKLYRGLSLQAQCRLDCPWWRSAGPDRTPHQLANTEAKGHAADFPRLDYNAGGASWITCSANRMSTQRS